MRKVGLPRQICRSACAVLRAAGRAGSVRSVRAIWACDERGRGPWFRELWDRPSRQDDHRSPRSGLRHLTKEDRIEFCLAVVLPVVVFWLLLLSAPASSQLGVGERIGAGLLFFALLS